MATDSRKAAELVMGWKPGFSRSISGMAFDLWLLPDKSKRKRSAWSPETNPADDYEVLCRVREKWSAEDKARFGHILETIWWARQEPKRYLKSAHPRSFMYHEPGDYARAAVAVKEGAK